MELGESGDTRIRSGKVNKTKKVNPKRVVEKWQRCEEQLRASGVTAAGK
jgi:hypothetical protein